MEVKKSSSEEHYLIKGPINHRLIPENTTSVQINYDANGKVQCVFYSNYTFSIKDSKKGLNSTEILERSKERLKQLDEMNARTLTLEEMNEIAGLLKKLSSK